MQTEAIFENIANRIQEEIKQAQKSIYIAVAWFTNKNIFEQLLLKAKEGCAIHILISNDEINNNSSINFHQLNNYKGQIFKIGNGDNELMHNKFCIIDYKTVITGSYNWSYKAENNFENIVINYNDTFLAEQFVNEFIQIKNKYNPIFEEKTKQKLKIRTKIVSRVELKVKIKEAITHPHIKNGTIFIAGVTIEKDNNGINQMIMEVVQKTELNNEDNNLKSNRIGLHAWIKITAKGFDNLFSEIGITGEEIQEKTADLTREESLMIFLRVKSFLIDGDEETPTISINQYSAENGLPNKIQKIIDIKESQRSTYQHIELERFTMRTNNNEPLVDKFGNQVYQLNQLTYGNAEHILINKTPLSKYKKL